MFTITVITLLAFCLLFLLLLLHFFPKEVFGQLPSDYKILKLDSISKMEFCPFSFKMNMQREKKCKRIKPLFTKWKSGKAKFNSFSSVSWQHFSVCNSFLFYLFLSLFFTAVAWSLLHCLKVLITNYFIQDNRDK